MPNYLAGLVIQSRKRRNSSSIWKSGEISSERIEKRAVMPLNKLKYCSQFWLLSEELPIFLTLRDK
jgi:hypothetical protein